MYFLILVTNLNINKVSQSCPEVSLSPYFSNSLIMPIMSFKSLYNSKCMKQLKTYASQ